MRNLVEDALGWRIDDATNQNVRGTNQLEPQWNRSAGFLRQE